MANKRSKDKPMIHNPEAFKKAVRDAMPRFKNTTAELSRKSGVPRSTLYAVMNDRMILTDTVKAKIEKAIGLPIEVPAAAVTAVDEFVADKTGRPSIAKIMAVAEAVLQLTCPEQLLLAKLVEFKTTDRPDSVSEVLIAIEEIATLREVLT